jgi:hypothetical protein
VCDIFLRPELTEGMEEASIQDLGQHVVPNCGHWTQTEKPAPVNGLMVAWPKRRLGRRGYPRAPLHAIVRKPLLYIQLFGNVVHCTVPEWDAQRSNGVSLRPQPLDY